MRALLKAVDYTSADVLAAEQSRLFRRLWIVAGFRATVDAPDAFLSHQIGDIPILIQNTRAGLRAFVNQCAHRQGAIQLADHGQRRMACPYHGWVYGDDGRVKSVPGNEANYGFCASTIQSLGLKPVHLRQVGGILFVNLADDPPPFEEQFTSTFLEQLAEISSKAGDDAIFAKFESRYNWKLNFENVVDWNHVPFVHAGSFAPLMPGVRRSVLDERHASPPPQPDEEIPDDLRELSYVVRAPFEFQEWPWHDSVERCGPTKEYTNVFIYPNVNYVVMAGVIHLIQQFCPVEPACTRVRLTMALGRRTRKLPAAAAILWSQFKAEKRVINEDVAVLEGLQRGLNDGSVRAFHGAYEHRLRRIAKTYRRLMVPR
jgi:phenylpropionate dioxygenase-like ring-hydroxylating dioxygenase large terminal subunit